MHIGLIGGIGPAATDLYHRGLIEQVGPGLDLTIAHASSATLIANQGAGRADAQAAIFATLTERLERAGAETVAVTSIAGHFCIDAFKAVSRLPVLDLLDSLAAHVADKGFRKVGVLGTRPVMESAVYGRLPGATVLAPSKLDAVHQAYVDMAMSGEATEARRAVFFEAGRALCADQGAEAVILGGTDLFLAFDGQEPGFPVIDAARAHIDEIAQAALG